MLSATSEELCSYLRCGSPDEKIDDTAANELQHAVARSRRDPSGLPCQGGMRSLFETSAFAQPTAVARKSAFASSRATTCVATIAALELRECQQTFNSTSEKNQQLY